MERELTVTLKCDGKIVAAEIFDALSGDSVTIAEPYAPDEQNPVWQQKVSSELYDWIGLDMEEEQR